MTGVINACRGLGKDSYSGWCPVPIGAEVIGDVYLDGHSCGFYIKSDKTLGLRGSAYEKTFKPEILVHKGKKILVDPRYSLEIFHLNGKFFETKPEHLFTIEKREIKLGCCKIFTITELGDKETFLRSLPDRFLAIEERHGEAVAAAGKERDDALIALKEDMRPLFT